MRVLCCAIAPVKNASLRRGQISNYHNILRYCVVNFSADNKKQTSETTSCRRFVFWRRGDFFTWYFLSAIKRYLLQIVSIIYSLSFMKRVASPWWFARIPGFSVIKTICSYSIFLFCCTAFITLWKAR